MQADYEKLGIFYLGKVYDVDARKRTEFPLLYESQDLTTHAMCVGMTGSGKTGLCLSLLEEAAIDGIPAIAIDPKGDLSNLMLQFPELRASDFEPWVDGDEARRNGIDVHAFAEQQARAWREGLAQWQQDGARIQRLKDAAEITIVTPGSNAGLPVSILKSFAAPPPAVVEDGEVFQERVASTVTSLLGLVGIDADPLQSKEHILLSNILDRSWRSGRDLDLAALIGAIQTPPVQRIGVFELEAFFPAKERFALAMRLNNLLASPSFSGWLEGDALDVGKALWTDAGKPRVTIYSIAHLSDPERMFFVSLLLNQTLSWMRTQSGTSSLRAILYMDEIAGYFPPVANPPSKAPLLTLLKQARAFGLGVVLATQNPVDLDYKGLANCGTWFIGRLQAERDKLRLLDGLEGASAQAGSKFDRNAIDQILSGLAKRVFLMNDVHRGQPVVFETRFALSYLRGPLTRAQIKTLMDPRRASAGAVASGSARGNATSSGESAASTASRTVSSSGSRASTGERNVGSATETSSSIASGAGASSSPTSPAPLGSMQPVLPPDVPQFFAPGLPRNATLRPAVLGCVQTYFNDTRTGVATQTSTNLLAPVESGPTPVDWSRAEEVDLADAMLTPVAPEGAAFAALAPEAQKAKSYVAWKKALVDEITRTEELHLFRCDALDCISKPFEPERDFRIRLAQSAREQRDREKARVAKPYGPKRAALEERLRRAKQAVEREAGQARDAKVSAAVSFGAAVLGALTGRRAISQSTMSRAATGVRGVGRAMRDAGDVDRAQETVASVEAQIQSLDAQLQSDLAALDSRFDPMTQPLEDVVLKPKKSNVTVRFLGLVWIA
jgi:hypothetical protein